MKKSFILLLTLLSITFSGISQNVIDSLQNELETANDEKRLEILFDLCIKIIVTYNQYQPQGLEYAKEARILAKSLNDQFSTGRADYLLGRLYTKVNYDTAILYLNRSIEVFKEIENDDFLAKATHSLGRVYQYKGQNDTALILYETALDYYRRISDNIRIMTILYNVATIQHHFGKYDEALKYFEQIFIIAEKDENLIWQNHAYNGIGGIYMQMAIYDEALEYYMKGLKIVEKMNDSTLLPYLHTNIGSLHDALEDYEKAIEYYTIAIKIFKEMNDKRLECSLLNLIGQTYIKSGKYEKAEDYCKRAYKLVEELGDKKELVICLNNLAAIALEYEQYDVALEYLLQAQPLVNDLQYEALTTYNALMLGHIYYYLKDYQNAIKHLIECRIRAINSKDKLKEVRSDTMLAVSYEQSGKYDSALYYFRQYTIIQDSIVNTETESRIAELDIRYETEKKEQQINLLESDNKVKELHVKQSMIFNWGLGGLIIIIILIAFLFIRQNKLKNEHKSTLLEQKLLRLQMNPHFIFNALSSIHSLMNPRDVNKASDYLGNFSRLLRSSLESSREDYILLEEEISSLNNYLELQQLRYEKKFDYEIDVDPKIDLESAILPPMLLQPFIENAIEHGIKHKEAKGHIRIRFNLENKKLTCEIEDDGVGREKAWEVKYAKKGKHKSLATEIIRDRIKILNKKLKQKINLAIIDKRSETEQPTGTLIRLDLPYILD